MIFKKRMINSILLALLGITISTPILNTVLAIDEDSNTNSYINNMEYSEVLRVNGISENEVNKAKENRMNFNSKTDEVEFFSEEQLKLFKLEFQQIHGVDNVFKIVSEDANSILESNGYKGILRYTNKLTNEVIDINLFESIEKLYNKYLNSSGYYTPNRPSSWKTQGPDVANMSVIKGSTRDTITVTHPTYGGKKTYTKPTDNWYSGYTKSYYDHVQGARRSFGTAKEKAGYSATTALTIILDALLSAGDFKITLNEMINLLKQSSTTILNATACATYAIVYLGEISFLINDYYNL